MSSIEYISRNKREGRYAGSFHGKHVRTGANKHSLISMGLKWRYDTLPCSWAARAVELNREVF